MLVDEMLTTCAGQPATEALKRCVAAGAMEMNLNDNDTCQMELYGCIIRFHSARKYRSPGQVQIHAAGGREFPFVTLDFKSDGTLSLGQPGPQWGRFQSIKTPVTADELIAEVDRLELVRTWHGTAPLPHHTLRNVLGAVAGASAAAMMGMAPDYSI